MEEKIKCFLIVVGSVEGKGKFANSIDKFTRTTNFVDYKNRTFSQTFSICRQESQTFPIGRQESNQHYVCLAQGFLNQQTFSIHLCKYVVDFYENCLVLN